MDGDKEVIKTPSKEEASVGSMLPVTEPDQILEKKTPITEESIDEAFSALQLGLNEESFTESVNAEITSTFSEYSEKFKKHITDAKKALRKKDYETSISLAKEAEKDMNKCLKEIDNMDSTVFESAIGTLITIVLSALHAAAWGLLGLGIASLASVIDDLSEVFVGFDHTLKKKGYKLDPTEFNAYRNKIISSIKTMQDVAKQVQKKAMKKRAKDEVGITESVSDVDDERSRIWDNINKLTEENGLSWFESVDGNFDESERCYLESMDDEEFFTEAGERDIDSDLKPLIKKLNEKGYKTKYSCSGHPSAISKTDIYRDGVKNGKLYSTARIVFAKIYDFPNIPKYWEKRILDEDKTAIYVKPPHFRIINGLPKDQFENWKNRYMYNLEKWVDELPDESDTKKDENSDVTLESAMDEMLTEMQIDCMD